MGQSITKNRWYLAALLVVALVASQLTATAAPTTGAWSTDSAHTEINFSVKHFFTPVTGGFEDYEITLDYNADVNTGNEKRDNHLRSGDWFETEKYPYITFKSTSVRKVGDNQLIATGPLTIKGESQQIELPITLLGNQMIPEQMQQMLGGTKEVASFQASTAIDRADFGVGVGSWAATMVVGGEVTIEILLEAHNS
jgi:polyisoprenoid-binding protein YceI